MCTGETSVHGLFIMCETYLFSASLLTCNIVFLLKVFPKLLILVINLIKSWFHNNSVLVVDTMVGLAQTHCRLAPTHLINGLCVCDSAYSCELPSFPFYTARSVLTQQPSLHSKTCMFPVTYKNMYKRIDLSTKRINNNVIMPKKNANKYAKRFFFRKTKQC